MCNAHAKVFNLLRLVMVCLTSFIVCASVSTPAQAQPLSTACQVTLTESEPTPNATRILTPITYRYTLTYHTSCQAKAILHAQSTMECHGPMTEVLPSQMPHQVMASVTVQCQFKRPGYYFTSPIIVEVSKLPNHEKQILSPKLQPITIHPHDPENASPPPLEASLQFMPWQKNNGHIWLALIALGIILVCSYFIHKRYAKTLKPVAPVVILPPSPIEQLKSELANLSELKPTDTESWKAYYDCLSHALRQYLTDRAQTDALQLTTYQLQSKLQELHLPSDLKNKLLAVLRQSDQVKFTPDMPVHADNLHLLPSMHEMADALEDFFIQRDQQMESALQDGTSTQANSPIAIQNESISS